MMHRSAASLFRICATRCEPHDTVECGSPESSYLSTRFHVADTINTIALGVIEGITEFLPISSTGHLLIAEHWLGERSQLFNVAIQAGAILAVVLIYWRRIVALFTRFDQPANRDYLFKLIVAFVITGIGGFVAVNKLGFKLPDKVLPIAIAELVGGVLILVIESYVAKKPESA